MPPSTHRTERPRDHRARPPPSACPAKRPVSGRGQGRQPPQAGARSASLEAGRSQVYLNTVAPRRRILFCHRRQRIKAVQARLGRLASARLSISNGCQDHTVLPYADTAPFVLRAVNSLTDRSIRPAITLRADAAASTASHPAFVTTAKRPSCRERTGRAGRTDLPDRRKRNVFCGRAGRPESR